MNINTPPRHPQVLDGVGILVRTQRIIAGVLSGILFFIMMSLSVSLSAQTHAGAPGLVGGFQIDSSANFTLDTCIQLQPGPCASDSVGTADWRTVFGIAEDGSSCLGGPPLYIPQQSDQVRAASWQRSSLRESRATSARTAISGSS